MLRAHRPLLLNWFNAKGTLSAAVVEGFNNKARVTTRTTYGFARIAPWRSRAITPLAS